MIIRCSYLPQKLSDEFLRKAILRQKAERELLPENWRIIREIPLESGLSHYLVSVPIVDARKVDGQKLYIGASRSVFQLRPHKKLVRPDIVQAEPLA